MNDVDNIISLRKLLANIWEADGMPSAPPVDAAAPAPEMPEQPVVDQGQLDRDVDDVMTTPKTSSPDDEDIANIADDLGVSNTQSFVQAFDALRSGAVDDQIDNAAITDAFARLMSADASTVQKTINRLREIYDKPLGA